MARADDDGIIRRIVVDGIDVCPVAARTRTDDVTEFIGSIQLGDFLRRERLAGL